MPLVALFEIFCPIWQNLGQKNAQKSGDFLNFLQNLGIFPSKPEKLCYFHVEWSKNEQEKRTPPYLAFLYDQIYRCFMVVWNMWYSPIFQVLKHFQRSKTGSKFIEFWLFYWFVSVRKCISRKYSKLEFWTRSDFPKCPAFGPLCTVGQNSSLRTFAHKLAKMHDIEVCIGSKEAYWWGQLKKDHKSKFSPKVEGLGPKQEISFFWPKSF